MREALLRNKLTIPEAAEQLGVKRQTLWLYLKEKSMPGGKVLARACRLWDLSLNVNGLRFNKEAFGTTGDKSTPAAKQLNLFRTLAEVRPDQIETKLVTSGANLFELRVRIKIAS